MAPWEVGTDRRVDVTGCWLWRLRVAVGYGTPHSALRFALADLGELSGFWRPKKAADLDPSPSRLRTRRVAQVTAGSGTAHSLAYTNPVTRLDEAARSAQAIPVPHHASTAGLLSNRCHSHQDERRRF